MKKLASTITLSTLLALCMLFPSIVQATGPGNPPAEIRLLSPENVIRRGNSLVMELVLPQAGAIRLEVVDNQGRKVWKQSLSFGAGQNRVKFQVGDLTPGTYFLEMQSGEQKDAQTFAIR